MLFPGVHFSNMMHEAGREGAYPHLVMYRFRISTQCPAGAVQK